MKAFVHVLDTYSLTQTLLFCENIISVFLYTFLGGGGFNEELILRVFCVLFGWDQDLTFS